MPDWYWKRQNKGRLAGRCIVRLSVSFFIGVFMGHHEIYNESRKGNHDRDSPLIGSYFLCVEVLMLEELKFSIQSIFSGNGIKI